MASDSLTTKCFVHFGKKLHPEPLLFLNSHLLPVVNEVKFLGLSKLWASLKLFHSKLGVLIKVLC